MQLQINVKERGGNVMGRGSWGFWAMGASQRQDVCPRVRLLFPGWPEASRFTRKLGSYQHRTGWCGAADGASWRLIVTDTNGAVPSHCGCRGWRLRAVVEETVRLSRRGEELKLTCVFFKGGADKSQTDSSQAAFWSVLYKKHNSFHAPAWIWNIAEVCTFEL